MGCKKCERQPQRVHYELKFTQVIASQRISSTMRWLALFLSEWTIRKGLSFFEAVAVWSCMCDWHDFEWVGTTCDRSQTVLSATKLRLRSGLDCPECHSNWLHRSQHITASLAVPMLTQKRIWKKKQKTSGRQGSFPVLSFLEMFMEFAAIDVITNSALRVRKCSHRQHFIFTFGAVLTYVHGLQVQTVFAFFFFVVCWSFSDALKFWYLFWLM